MGVSMCSYVFPFKCLEVFEGILRYPLCKLSGYVILNQRNMLHAQIYSIFLVRGLQCVASDDTFVSGSRSLVSLTMRPKQLLMDSEIYVQFMGFITNRHPMPPLPQLFVFQFHFYNTGLHGSPPAGYCCCYVNFEGTPDPCCWATMLREVRHGGG